MPNNENLFRIHGSKHIQISDFSEFLTLNFKICYERDLLCVSLNVKHLISLKHLEFLGMNDLLNIDNPYFEVMASQI